MKLTILHLSDVHIHNADDPILQHANAIASSIFPHIRSADACLILVTGDIAFSGSEREYALAKVFLSEIRSAIKNEGCPLVDVLTVPGNHDCQLIPENRARTVIIESLISNTALAEDPKCVEICVSAQTAYFNFVEAITESKPVNSNSLWSDYHFAIAGKVVIVSAINASWMSRLPENQGSLVFPTQQFEEWLSVPAELRIAMLHHPLNWYSQSSYHALRTALRTSCSVVMSGHEHFSAGGEISEFGCGHQLFFEAPALQPHEKGSEAGFTCLVFDTENNLVTQQPYQIAAGEIHSSQSSELDLHSILRGSTNCIPLTKDFELQLRDSGGGFAHPDKDVLEIDDVFVYPELRNINREEKSEKKYSTPSETVLFQDDSPKTILILGEEKSGKTSLLYRAFKEYRSQGLTPIYLKAEDISSFSANEISKIITIATKRQYEDSAAANQSERSKRICLLDDLDRIRNTKRLEQLIKAIEAEFSKIIITASQDFEIRELVNTSAAKALDKYRTYEICRFGNALRHRLIHKWCQIGGVNTLPELDRAVHKIEEVVNAIVSRNLIPPLPFYLLILLQSYSQHQQGELQNSGFARYYEYLMTRSLAKSGIQKDAYDELFNYVSQLSWLFRDTDKEEATKQELEAFTRQYSQQYFNVNLDERLTLLENARLLTKRGNCYHFSYPYVYYFFLGRYLAKNLAKEEIKTKVRNWCSKLYLRKNAHAIIFLSYHSNDDWIIEQVSSILDDCFPDTPPVELDDDIVSINTLVNSTTKLLLDAPNVTTNQENFRRNKDENEEKAAVEKEYPENGEAALIGKVHLLLKTSEILGQIIKNYYGSIERPRKEALIQKVISAPLRLLRFVIQHIADDPNIFISEIEKAMGEKFAYLDIEEKQKVARDAAFQFLRFVSTGAVLRAAEWIGSERLEDDISQVIRNNPTTAFKLIEAGTQLMLPKDLALDRLEKFSKELERNPFAFGILQSMGVRYLHLFHVRIRDRQKLCEMLKIEFTETKGIDLRTRKTKLLK